METGSSMLTGPTTGMDIDGGAAGRDIQWLYTLADTLSHIYLCFTIF